MEQKREAVAKTEFDSIELPMVKRQKLAYSSNGGGSDGRQLLNQPQSGYDGHQLMLQVVGEMMATMEGAQMSNLTKWAEGLDNLCRVFPQLRTGNKDMPEEPDFLPVPNRSSKEMTATDGPQSAWISITAAELTRFLDSGGTLPKHVSTLRISNSFDDFGDAQAAFLRWIQNDGIELPYQTWDHVSDYVKFMTNTDFLDRYARRSQQGARDSLTDFRNCLSISGSCLEKEVPEPPFFKRLGYNLLTTLKQRLSVELQVTAGNPGGKETVTPMRTIDCEACLRFALFGERYSYSGWHMDILNGTYVTIVTGLKAWFIYTGPWTDKEKTEFSQKGMTWTPAPGTVKMIVLRPEDTLVMRPGFPVIHAVLTLDDSLAAGGMIWANTAIPKIMENLAYILPYAVTTNELIPRQLPEYLDALYAYVTAPTPMELDSVIARLMKLFTFTAEDAVSVKDLIASLKKGKLLSCSCKGTCTTKVKKGRKICPC